MNRFLKVAIIFSIFSYINGMEIVGKIKVKGSSPHTYLVIEDINTKKSYQIKNATDFNLTNRQNQILKLDVNITQKALGPGFPAVVEVLKIIEIKE